MWAKMIPKTIGPHKFGPKECVPNCIGSGNETPAQKCARKYFEVQMSQTIKAYVYQILTNNCLPSWLQSDLKGEVHNKTPPILHDNRHNLAQSNSITEPIIFPYILIELQNQNRLQLSRLWKLNSLYLCNQCSSITIVEISIQSNFNIPFCLCESSEKCWWHIKRALRHNLLLVGHNVSID